MLIEEAFADEPISHDLHTAGDGVLALESLRGPDRPHPDLILLDLNMPRMNGRELLAQIKADPALRAIPVVVLSTSTVDQDVADSYEPHANAHVTKPVDFDQFIASVQHIHDGYLGVGRLPKHPHNHAA